MKRFAEVRGGQVAVVFDWPVPTVPPAFDPEVAQAVEVTGLEPEPGPGWAFADGVFTPPPGPEEG